MRFFLFLLFVISFSLAQNSEELLEIFEQDFSNKSIDNFIFVEGNHLSTIEMVAINYIKSNSPNYSKYYRPLNDSSETLKFVKNASSDKIIILIGGPSQNKISEEVISLGWMKEKTKLNYYAELIIQNGTNPKMLRYLLFLILKVTKTLSRKAFNIRHFQLFYHHNMSRQQLRV